MIKIYIILFCLFSFNLAAEVIQKLEVKGNERISKETIRVYGEINIGEDFSPFELNEITKNLYKTNFFETIDLSLSKGVLEISVKEYPTINSISFQGEKRKDIRKTILEKLELKEKGSFIENNLAQDIEIIKKLYSSIGYNFSTVEAKIERFDNNRINLIFLHISFLFVKVKNIKENEHYKLFSQRIFDLIFKQIELNLREIGHGDVMVNKKMKLLVKFFYSILFDCENYRDKKPNEKSLIINKYLTINNVNKSNNTDDIVKYFDKYEAFCLDLSSDSVLKGEINFNI